MTKKRRTMLAKRRYKMRVIAQLTPTTPTPTASTPTLATTSTQMPVLRSTKASILVTVYKLVTGQFSEVPYPTGRLQNERNPSVCNSNPPLLEDIPKAPVREGNPWHNAGSASENLFQARKDWPFPPTPAPTLTVKT